MFRIFTSAIILYFQTWMHLLTKIDQHNEITVELVLSNFLEFMFTPMGSLPPVCRFLDLDCAAVFLQLLKTANLFQIGQLPESMIEYSLICITFIHKKDPTLSVNIWESLLGKFRLNLLICLCITYDLVLPLKSHFISIFSFNELKKTIFRYITKEIH